MRRQSLPSLVVAAALGVGLTACGGDDQEADQAAASGQSESPSPASPSPADGTPSSSPTTSQTPPVAKDGSWVRLTDAPSETKFALPTKVEPTEDEAPLGDGSEVTLRNYSAIAAGGVVEVGFNVIDTEGGEYSLDAGVDGVANTLEGQVVSSDPIKVDGNAGYEVEMTYGEDKLVLFQLIATEQHVLQTLASGPATSRADIEKAYVQLNSSVVVG